MPNENANLRPHLYKPIPKVLRQKASLHRRKKPKYPLKRHLPKQNTIPHLRIQRQYKPSYPVHVHPHVAYPNPHSFPLSRPLAQIYQSSSSPSPGLLSFPLGPSFLIGILIPCVAKHLLRFVLSMTPGNFFALKTWKMSLKQDARTGAEAVLSLCSLCGQPTFTKFIFNLSGLAGWMLGWKGVGKQGE